MTGGRSAEVLTTLSGHASYILLRVIIKKMIVWNDHSKCFDSATEGVLVTEVYLTWKLRKLSKGIVRSLTRMHVDTCREIKNRNW